MNRSKRRILTETGMKVLIVIALCLFLGAVMLVVGTR